MTAIGWFALGLGFFALLCALVLAALQTYDTFRAWEYNRKKKDVPAKTPGPSGLGEPVIYYCSVDWARPTPDRPEPYAYWEGLSVEEICAELEGK